MNINDIINAMPYLSKRELYEIHTAVNKTIKQVEESEQEYREKARQRQREIVDEMNKCLREFHNLSASLRDPDSNDYLDSYSDCFIDSVYDYPVFGFTIDCYNDISCCRMYCCIFIFYTYMGKERQKSRTNFYNGKLSKNRWFNSYITFSTSI